MWNSVLCVCGSRALADSDLPAIASFAFAELGRLDLLGYSEVWHGGARGGDEVGTILAGWAGDIGHPARVWPAMWIGYGRSAGFRRSAEMVKALPDDAVVLALFADTPARSPGTNHTISCAQKRGLRVVVLQDLLGLLARGEIR